MAHIEKRFSKKRGSYYRVRITCGVDSQGSPKIYSKNIYPTAKTEKGQQKQVHDEAVLFEQAVLSGKVGYDEGETFSSFTEKWLKEWASENLTQSQYESYYSSIQIHAFPVIGNKRLADIKKRDCITIVNNIKNLGRSPKTIRRIVSAIRSVFKYALYLELINEDPSEGLILPPIKKDNELHCFDVEQAERFLNALEMKYPVNYGGRKRKNSNGEEYSVKSYVSYQEIPLQFRVYFNLAIKGGFRRGELIGLTWQDIDFDSQTISISKAVSLTKTGQKVGRPKTPSAIRTVYMPIDCMEMLEELYDQQKELAHLSSWHGQPLNHIEKNNVFTKADGTMMDLSTPAQRFESIVKNYNKMIDAIAKDLPPEEKEKKLKQKLPLIRLHDLRHTYATILISNNVDIVTVSKLMGHASPSITTDVYSHLLRKNATEAACVFERIFAPTAQEKTVILQS